MYKTIIDHLFSKKQYHQKVFKNESRYSKGWIRIIILI